LLRHNWFPATVFVGDTFCYFAGMTLAVAGILGHFGKTLLLFFFPQLFNFVYSLPQLFGLVPCPRHRLPKADSSSGLLYPSTVQFKLTSKNRALVRTLLLLGLLTKMDEDGEMITTNNWTLLNLLLIFFGPLREDHLTILLMAIQASCTLSALLLRFHVAPYFFSL